MKKYFVLLTAIVTLLFTLHAKGQTVGKVVVAPEVILKSMPNLLDYYSSHLNFDAGFLSYNEAGATMDNGQFLKKIAAGGYLPLQVYSKEKSWAYRLLKLGDKTNDDVRVMIKQIGLTEYGRYQTIGKPFPKFSYTDINGHTYTTENTKGKIVVLKGWFIGCVPCAAEMPQLNKLTEQYKNRKDVVFISMASNTKKQLQGFLKKQPFNYAVVPVTQDYMLKNLHATGFPVHWVINKQGVVVSMGYDKDQMIPALTREAAKI